MARKFIYYISSRLHRNPLILPILTKPEVNPNVPMPDGLHPVVQERTNQLVQQAAQKGISIIITDDFRSAEDQDLLYEKVVL